MEAMNEARKELREIENNLLRGNKTKVKQINFG